MTEFQTAVDIGNRALQHLGQRQMSTALGFSEPSKNAAEISFAYGKLRRAELRRAYWKFATKKAALRAIDANTLLIQPAVWSSTLTYFKGSLVSDQSNNVWVSILPSNLNNQPSSSPLAWEPYYGPMTASLYDSTMAYIAGEVVYTAAGNGTWNVWLSLLTGNSVHPALPEQWAAGTTFYKNQVVQQFPAWSSGTAYSQGQGALYTDGNVYVSLVNSNLNHVPPSSATQWALLPVLTLTTPTVPSSQSTSAPPTSSPVLEWSSGTTYALGNAVMFNGIEYVSLQNSNTANFPNAAGSTFWAQVSSYTLYMSLTDINIGNNPSTTFVAPWASGTTYASGNQVTGSNGIIYTSKGNGNLGNDPTLDNGTNWTNTGSLSPWTTAFTLGGGNSQWMQVGGSSAPGGVALTTLNLSIYPAGSGPLSQAQTRNVFRLPFGFLRRAPEDPKAGSFSWLGAPSGLVYRDWLIESGYLISADPGPIMLRFIADVTDVTRMDDMFCEGLAARIAMEACEPLTQSTAKLQTLNAIYKQAMNEARQANAIEVGPVEPPLDDWLACRY